MSQWKILGRSDDLPNWLILDSFPTQEIAERQIASLRDFAAEGHHFVVAKESHLPFLPIQGASAASAG